MDNINFYDELLNTIKNGIDPNWTTLEKIRYAYITVGKNIRKDTDFFLSLKKKLDELNLSAEDLYKIYNDDKTINSDNWNKVICKSAAIILNRIYTDLNIPSKIVETIDFDDDLDFEIHHFFLSVNDGADNYFLTLVADLPNIQNGLRTEHFGNNIDYYREDSNGISKQVYKGDEIKHRIIPLDELKRIDDKIGYTTTFAELKDPDYVNYLIDKINLRMAKNRWYYDSVAEHTEFYNKFFIDNPYLTINNDNRQKYLEFIRDICKYVEENIIGTKIYNEDFQFNNWYNMVNEYPNLTSEMKKALKIVKDLVDSIGVAYKTLDEKGQLVDKDLIKFKKQFDRKSHKLAECFVKKSFMPPNTFEYATNDYISNKLELMFMDFFEANTNTITDYNKLDYSEQIDIIKNIFIPMTFKDLSKDNCQVDKMNYDENYSAILNRIYIRALKNKENGEYSLSFVVRGNEDSRYFVYDLKKNTFKEKNNIEVIELLQKHVVCRNNNLNNINIEIEDVEQILVNNEGNNIKK